MKEIKNVLFIFPYPLTSLCLQKHNLTVKLYFPVEYYYYLQIKLFHVVLLKRLKYVRIRLAELSKIQLGTLKAVFPPDVPFRLPIHLTITFSILDDILKFNMVII